jgi:phosphoglycerate dehydrogenase-like enzyme
VEPAELDDLLRSSKIVSLHAAKTPETRNLIDARRLALLQDGALFINTSRGSVVDEAELARALAGGRFTAVLDVYQEEPLPPSSPLIGLPNAILVPHMAGPTIDRRRFAALAVVEDAERFLAGKPLENEIDRAYAMAMTQ